MTEPKPDGYKVAIAIELLITIGALYMVAQDEFGNVVPYGPIAIFALLILWLTYRSSPAGLAARRRRSAIVSGQGTAEASAANQVLEKYSVNYRGGWPAYPSGHAGAIDLLVTQNAFVLRPTLGSKAWFAGLTIPYRTVTSFAIADRQVSTVEGVLGGLNSRQLNQANNIQIGVREGGRDLVLRLEMLSGTFVMAQAANCRQLVDRLRVHGILDRLGGSGTPASSSTAGPDVLDQLAKLGELHNAGVLSSEEFDAKKTELLSRL